MPPSPHCEMENSIAGVSSTEEEPPLKGVQVSTLLFKVRDGVFSTGEGEGRASTELAKEKARANSDALEKVMMYC